MKRVQKRNGNNQNGGKTLDDPEVSSSTFS